MVLEVSDPDDYKRTFQFRCPCFNHSRAIMLMRSIIDPSDSDSDVVIPSSGTKRKQFKDKGFMSSNHRRGLISSDNAGDSGSDLIHSSARKRRIVNSNKRGSESSDSESDSISVGNIAAVRSTKGHKKSLSTGDGLSGKGSAIFSRNSTTTGNGTKSKAPVVELSDDDSDEEPAYNHDSEPTLPTPRATQPINNIQEVEDDSDDVFEPWTRSSQRQSRQTQIISDDDDDDENNFSAVSEMIAERTVSTMKRVLSASEDSGDDENDADAIVSPIKRRRLSPKKSEEKNSSPRTPLTRKAKAKASEANTPSRLTRSSQPRRHRTEREKHLELIQRRRAGEKITELTPSGSDSDGEPGRGLYDTDSSLEVLSEFEDEELDSQDNEETLRQSIRGVNRDNYDDDFVVDDDDNLGAPTGLGLHDIPLEFTHAAHKPLKDHFTDCVEWMVQRKINPAFAGNDPIYVQAFRKVDDEVRGLANSKFTSSVWKQDFSRALWARPEFLEEEVVDAMEHLHCGACNRNHPTKFVVQFGGNAYSKGTLEDVEPDSDDDNEDDVDEHGNPILPASHIWHVGSFCKRNAEMAHSLIHWKHSLNSWVLDQLEAEGHLKSKKLKERENWTRKKRGDYANKIVDGWSGSGKQIKGLWRDFKIQLESARTFDHSRYGRTG